ncbi:MAG: 6-phosphogluconolactonase [Verrucomicrobiota bacterium]
MSDWETFKEAEWLDQIANLWVEAGSKALHSRGQFTVAMDASPESLQACRHLAKIDWPWSATLILPARENWVPNGHRRHCGSAIYQALYPKKVNLLHWETEHMSHQQSADRYAKALKKEAGEQPKLDLTLIALSGEHTLGEVETGQGGIPEFELTALYQSRVGTLPALGLTPWMLQASRMVACISKGLNPPQTDTLQGSSPLDGLLAQVKHSRLLHTR